MRLKLLLLFAATLMLSACATTTSNTTQASKPAPFEYIPMTPVDMGCISHDGAPYIYAAYVQEPFSQRMAGGTSCGGKSAVGYMLPLQWRPGMKVKVRWKPNARDWIEKTTTIRRYDEAGTLYVHFFENDEVRVVSSAIYPPESPNHPILKNVTIAPPEEE